MRGKQLQMALRESAYNLCMCAVYCTTELCPWRASGAGQDLSVGKGQLNDDCLGSRPHTFAQIQFQNS